MIQGQQSMSFDGAEAITLVQFNTRIKQLLNHSSVQGVWIQAETSDVRISRHAYMELLQKDEQGNNLARISAVIWGNTLQAIMAKFTAVTGKALENGMKVMLQVSASYHENYGLKVIITDINPEFTLGDMMRRRMEILQQLTKEGIINLNKEVPLNLVPQRIAVISAASAAGYGDFFKQLHSNSYGLQFYTCLFAALMQGENTVPSVLAALHRVQQHVNLFDAVVIIRGGGSSTDLNAFDSYELAATIARFPLPVIVGIGHERDETVLDYVAHTRVKTPTAAAEFLLQQALNFYTRIERLRTDIVTATRSALALSAEQLSYYRGTIPLLVSRMIETNRLKLHNVATAIPLSARQSIEAQQHRISQNGLLLSTFTKQILGIEERKLEHIGQTLNLLSPRNLLNRGFALAMHNGKFITSADELREGDHITVHLKQGRVEADVKKIN